MIFLVFKYYWLLSQLNVLISLNHWLEIREILKTGLSRVIEIRRRRLGRRGASSRAITHREGAHFILETAREAGECIGFGTTQLIRSIA